VPRKRNLELLYEQIPKELQQFQSQFVDLPFLKFAGLSSKNQPVRFYCRDHLQKLIGILDKKNCLIVEGPPGVGKSMTSWLWVLRECFKKSVLWIHTDETINMCCLLKDGQVQSYDRNINIIETIDSCVSDVLVIDGIASKSSDSYDILKNALSWKDKDRKLIIVTSVQLQVKMENAINRELEHHFVPSWSLTDYVAAFNDKNFFADHSNAFEGFDSVLEQSEKIAKKYYIAGGSARWMIGFTPIQAEEDLLLQIRRCSDPKALIGGLNGDRSVMAINHLLLYDDCEKSTFLISQFAIRILSEKCSVEFLRDALSCPLSRNPSFDGWLFEFDFLIHLRHAQKSNTLLTLAHFESSKVKLDDSLWSASRCIDFAKEDASDICVNLANCENVWLIPQKWNQGCYDAVQLLSNGTVRTVQVTRGSSHTIKFNFITLLFDSLKRNGFKITSLELAFVVPHDHDLKTFSGGFGNVKLPTQYQKYWKEDSGFDKNYDTKEGYHVYGFHRTKA
jgi:hypothetical protein